MGFGPDRVSDRSDRLQVVDGSVHHQRVFDTKYGFFDYGLWNCRGFVAYLGTMFPFGSTLTTQTTSRQRIRTVDTALSRVVEGEGPHPASFELLSSYSFSCRVRSRANPLFQATILRSLPHSSPVAHSYSENMTGKSEK